MRISENGMVRTVVNDLMSNRSRLSDLQEQLSSGSIINRPSDDPGGTATVMQLRGTLSELDQYKSNADYAHDWLAATESALNEATETLDRVRELAVQGASETLGDDSLYGIAQEVAGLKDHLISLANTRHSGRYIFAGYDTRNAPVEVDADGEIVQSYDLGPMMYEVGPGIRMQINVSGERVFSGLLELVGELEEALLVGEHGQVGDMLEDLDAEKDRLLAVRAEMGGRMNRLELSENRLEELELSVRRVMSNTRDADVAELVMHLATAERAYQTSLAAGARILPQTLLDFLR